MATAEVPVGAFRLSDHYKPFAHQVAFHQSPAKYRMQVGSFGSGKSRPLLWEGIFHALEYPGSDSVILRTTFPDLERTVESKFLSEIPREVYDYYNRDEHCAYFHPRKRRRFDENGWIKKSKAKSCLKPLTNGVDCHDQRLSYVNQCEFCQEFEVVRSKLWFLACNRPSDTKKFLSTDYVFIGFEEAGEFSFAVFDALCNRNRCAIPGSRPCVGGATNPMGVGWPFIKRLFKDHLPMPQMEADKYNPADYELFHSTIDQNPVLFKDKEYVAKLEASPNRDRIRYGRLDAVSGQYFACFEPRRHVQPASAFIFQHWQQFTIGWDYGFGHFAVMMWLVKAVLKPNEEFGWLKPKTVNVFTRELFMREKTPAQQTEAVIASIPQIHDEHGQFVGFKETVDSVHLSWERFNRTTSDYTVAMEIGDLLSAAGLPRPLSSNRVERIAGWTKMYQLFESDELFILAGECPALEDSLPLLVRGDGITTSLEDVVKPKGLSFADDVGDACLAAGTLITTARGDVPIESVTTDDYVLTRKGYRRVKWSGSTGVKEVVQFGPLLITENHPVMTDRGFVIVSDTLCQENLFVRKKSFLTAAPIVGTPKANMPIFENTSVGETKKKRTHFSISKFIENITGRFLGRITSIMSMETRLTIIRIISRLFRGRNTCGSMAESTSFGRTASDAEEDSALAWTSKIHTDDIAENPARDHRAHVFSAEKISLSRTASEDRDSVPTLVRQHGVGRKSLTAWKRIASFVARNSSAASSCMFGFARVSVPLNSRCKLKSQPVFNLSVDQMEEYFANGILVHNCRYTVAGALLDPDQMPEEDRERERLAKIEDPMARAVAAYTSYNKGLAQERKGSREVIVPSWMKKHGK